MSVLVIGLANGADLFIEENDDGSLYIGSWKCDEEIHVCQIHSDGITVYPDSGESTGWLSQIPQAPAVPAEFYEARGYYSSAFEGEWAYEIGKVVDGQFDRVAIAQTESLSKIIVDVLNRGIRFV